MPMEIHEDKIIMRAGKYNLPKPWVGLTEAEIDECFSKDPRVAARNAEAKLKEKNYETTA
jgi:hypothetical protein